MRGAATIVLRAGSDALLLWNHALLELIQNREQLARCLLDVRHRRLELIRGVETAQVVRGSAADVADVVGP